MGMNETPDRSDRYEEDAYDLPEQREDPNEEERRESIEEARKALHEKRVADELVNIVIPNIALTRKQAE